MIINRKVINHLSDSSLAKITPTRELSESMLGEMIVDVDCENPKDINFQIEIAITRNILII